MTHAFIKMMKYMYEIVVISQKNIFTCLCEIQHKQNFVTRLEQVYTLRLRKHWSELNLLPYQAQIDSTCKSGRLVNWLITVGTDILGSARDRRTFFQCWKSQPMAPVIRLSKGLHKGINSVLIQGVRFWCSKCIIKAEIRKPSCGFRGHTLLPQSRENNKLHTKSRFFSHRWRYLWSQGRSFETLINYMWWRCLKDASVLMNSCSKHWSWNNFYNKTNDLRVFCSLNPATQMGTWHTFLTVLCIFVYKHCVVLHILQSLILELQAAAVTQPPRPGSALWVVGGWMLFVVGEEGLLQDWFLR